MTDPAAPRPAGAQASDYLEPRYCNQCGTPVAASDYGGEVAWPCRACGHVQVRRPTAGAAAVVVEGGSLLLVQRRYGSLAGRWCIPCGHVGWAEDPAEAAAREVAEETGLQVSIGTVVAVLANTWRPQRCTVGIWFHAERTGGTLRAGDDAADAGFFPLDRLPDLAFPTDRTVIDRIAGSRGDDR